MLEVRMRELTGAVIVMSALVLDSAGQYHLPLRDLEVVTTIEGGDIVALDSAVGSDETIFANEVGLFFVVKNDAVAEEPWLDLSSIVIDPESGNDSRGLSDFVLSPQHESDRAIYVSYTPRSDAEVLRVSRIIVSSDAVPIEDVLLEMPFTSGPNPYPSFGGDMEFGPDGFLYIATGDGYLQLNKLSGVPPTQALGTFDGKILRIDVSKNLDGLPYAVPDDNPFVDVDDALPEIWATGLQNPRIAFDTDAGRLFVIDGVGGEEVNVLEIDASRGRNFGWPYFKASLGCYHRGPIPRPTDTVMPLFDPEQSKARGFHTARSFVKDGVLYGTDRGSTVYFAVEPHFDRDYAIGTATNQCCINSQGFSTAGRGAGGDALYVSREGTVYRSIPATSIQPPRIEVSSTDNGTAVSGWGTLQFAPSPFYLAVYYTTDGSRPTTASTAWDWENPPLLVDSITVKAIAYHPSTGPSEVETKHFNLKTARVSFERVDTNPNLEAAVVLSTATPGAEIHFTLDGSMPGERSPLYDPRNPPIVSGPSEILVRAVAFRPDLGLSTMTSWSFNFGMGRVNLAGNIGNVGTVFPGQEVALIGTAGARIHYTLDGSKPTEASPIYTEPIPSKDAVWIQTLSVMEGYEPRYGSSLGVRLRIPTYGSGVWLAGGGNSEEQNVGIPAFDARFRNPGSMVEATDGTVYAISGGRGVLYSLSPDGIVKFKVFEVGNNFQFSDIAILPNDDLVLAMRGYPGVMIASLSESGIVEDSPEIVSIENPQHVTVSEDGTIYVASGETIRTIASDGTMGTLGGIGATFVDSEPVALADVKFRELRDIAAAPGGSLYIGDGARLLRLADGMVALVAGAWEDGYTDGQGSAALLPSLEMITVDKAGVCFVPSTDAEEESYAVRRITPQGEVTTVYLLADPMIDQRAGGVLAKADGSLVVSAGDLLYAVTLSDADGDGVNDADESAPLVPGVDDRIVDSDQDGRSNVAEHVFGSSASSPASFPADWSIVALPNGTLALLFPTETGLEYSIDASEDLRVWRPINTMTGGAFSRTLHQVYPENWRRSNHYRAVPK
ncbi:MAG: chitobiase/beta-hexosaminidase C-terminal domain-containing protein [Verrucomicrobiae bacterium]|nr:chitobiase/beta-hexosaminidase C-terminal domain-containing protein [Verrucomicrobiae bacterium]